MNLSSDFEGLTWNSPSILSGKGRSKTELLTIMHLFWRGLSGEIVKTPLPFILPLTNVPSKSYLEYDMKYEDVHDVLLEKIEWTKNWMTQNVYRNYKK